MQYAMSDKYLLEEILKLKEKFGSKWFIETGTWKGQTVDKLSKHFENIMTFENNQSFYREAVEVNKNNKNVLLHFKDSVAGFRENLTQEHNNAIFFLDAHWYEYFPLLDELKVIKEKNIKPIILIHDFYTPDENGKAKYGYDTYGSMIIGHNLVKEYMEKIYDNNYKHYCLQSEINSGVGVYMVEEK